MGRPVRDISAIFGNNALLDGTETIESIDCRRLVPYNRHPFNDISDMKKQVLAKSIIDDGILNPIIVHEQPDGSYMILAGHKRNAANILAGNKEIACIVKKGLSEVQKVQIVNRTNLTQTGTSDLTYMEQARAYLLEYETLLSEKKTDDKGDSRCTREFLAKQYGMTDSTFNRILSLNKLIKDFQDMLNLNKLKFSIAVEIARLTNEEQKCLFEFLCNNHINITTKNFKSILEMSKQGVLNEKKLKTDKKSINIKIENGLEMFKDIDNKVVKQKIQKSIEFSEITLPEWLSNNGYCFDDINIFDNLMDLLDKVLVEKPELLLWKKL